MSHDVPPEPPAEPEPSGRDQPFRFPRQYRPGQEPPEPELALPWPETGPASWPETGPVSWPETGPVSWPETGPESSPRLPPAQLPSVAEPTTGEIAIPRAPRRSWFGRHRLMVVLLAGCLAVGLLAGVAAAVTPV